MNRNKILLLVIMFSIGILVYAKEPPYLIKKLQKAAPEKIEIKVLR